MFSRLNQTQQPAERLIFLDEPEAMTNMTRRYGRAPIGPSNSAKIAALQQSCKSLEGDTQLIADEMEMLVHGARLSDSESDTSGYH